MSIQSEKPSHKITLQSLLDNIQKAKDIKSIHQILTKQVLGVFQVEMASIFLQTKSRQDLTSWLLIPGDSLKKIFVPIETNSIVGYVASKIKSVNIRNPYDFQELRRAGSELSFSDSYDKEANVRSRQVLAIPIVKDDTLIGVFQLINKDDDTHFSGEDEQKARELALLLANTFFTYGNFAKPVPPKYEPLLNEKLLSQEELEQGLKKAAELGEPLESVLMSEFKIPKRKMGELMADFFFTRFVDLEEVDNNPWELFTSTNIEYFENEEMVPLSFNKGKLVAAAKDFEDQKLASTIQNRIPQVKQVELVFSFQEDISSYWKRTKAKHLNAPQKDRKKQQEPVDTSLFDILDGTLPPDELTGERVRLVERVVESKVDVKYSGDTPVENNAHINDPQVVQLLAKIIDRGYSTKASYVHIEPNVRDEYAEVRYRIESDCSMPLRLSLQSVMNVVDRIKFLASMRRDERSRPQAGRFNFTTSGGKEIELRVTTIPTANSSEDIVFSILPGPKPLVPLDKLIPSRLLALFQKMIEQQQGIVLVVGPKVSGKTTTLHSALAHINSTQKKIWTAEYPIEIQQNRIRQVQVAPFNNYSYADALYVFLSADPDVIMIGDMQDPRAAVMAANAALSGHLLLSGLTADSAAQGIIQCMNMGIDPAHLAIALNGILAQQLVRTLCNHCKEPYHPPKDEYDLLIENYGVAFFEHINVMYSDDLVFHRAKGCPKCNNSGYHGKRGLYELLVPSQTIRKLIMKRASLNEIIDEAMIDGMTLVFQEGAQLIFKGTIDTKELMSTYSR